MRVTLTARVQDGRLEVEEAIDLPDGTEVDLVVVAGEEDRAEERRLALFLEAVRAGLADAEAGRVVDDSDLDRELDEALGQSGR